MAEAHSVLVIGNGGREHALCWKLAQSPLVAQIYCVPGNGGTATEQKTENIPLDADNFDALIAFAREKGVSLTVVGPEKPLADGIVDAFEAAGLPIFGPPQAAAQLEASKAFSKAFMRENNLPSAAFEVFDNPAAALAYCQSRPQARVIKVDGLAQGKGVYVCDSETECEAALSEIFTQGRFGASGAQVVVEDKLVGPEFSLMVLTDGQILLPFEASQDFKRRFENNQGPNTGGMGAYSPVPLYRQYEAQVTEQVLKPLEKALQQADFQFKGLLYVGVMIHEERPYILEFNVRFGDPETECLLPRLENDLFQLMQATVKGQLADCSLNWKPQACTTVVLCADSYPAGSSQDQPITLNTLPPDVAVFHAGTRLNDQGQVVTNGGRVLNIVGQGPSPEEAAQQAYQVIGTGVGFPEMGYRTDIAKGIQACLSASSF